MCAAAIGRARMPGAHCLSPLKVVTRGLENNPTSSLKNLCTLQGQFDFLTSFYARVSIFSFHALLSLESYRPDG